MRGTDIIKMKRLKNNDTFTLEVVAVFRVLNCVSNDTRRRWRGKLFHHIALLGRIYFVTILVMLTSFVLSLVTEHDSSKFTEKKFSPKLVVILIRPSRRNLHINSESM